MALTVDIVAPDRVLWSGAASFVSAQAVEGSIGLYPGHEPLLSLLAAGDVIVDDEAGNRSVHRVGGGFISLDHDRVTVVAEPTEL